MSTLSSHFYSIAKSRLARQALTLASGTALAQCIGTLAAPILSRLYTPAEFGVLGSLIAIIGVIALVGSLKYEMAIVTEPTEQNAIAVTGLSCHLLTAVTILSAVCFLAIILLSPSVIKEPQLLNMLPYGIVIIFSTGLYNILNFFLIRQEKYSSLAKGRVAKRIGTVLVQIIMGTQGTSDRIDNPIKLFELYKKTTLLLTFAIILPAIIIFLYGQGIFSLVFGQEWAVSGQYAEWMILWISIAMINPPATSTLHVLKKQKNLLIFDSVLFIARFMRPIISCNKFQAL